MSVQTITCVFCDAKAGMELSALSKTASSVLFMPHFGTEYEGSSRTTQSRTRNHPRQSIQVPAKTKDHPRAIPSLLYQGKSEDTGCCDRLL